MAVRIITEEGCVVGTFSTVQAAVDAAPDGATLELGEGTFVETIIVTRSLSIHGAGPAKTHLDAGGSGRVLKVERGAVVRLSGATLRNGRTYMELEKDGAGIWNLGELTIVDCVVTGNIAADDGGGIRNEGRLQINRCSITGNQATGWGGAGGGLYNPALGGPDAGAVIRNSTIDHNSASNNGGGIWNDGRVELINCTISGNRAGATGGAIRNNGTMRIRSCTIVDNIAVARGGGVCDFETTISSSTIIARNWAQAAPDWDGILRSGGHNLLQDPVGCQIDGDAPGDIVAENPLLGPLKHNGGPTQTHALLRRSPAIDAGGPRPVGIVGLETDQRGERRVQDGNGDSEAVADIGAYERLPATEDGRMAKDLAKSP